MEVKASTNFLSTKSTTGNYFLLPFDASHRSETRRWDWCESGVWRDLFHSFYRYTPRPAKRISGRTYHLTIRWILIFLRSLPCPQWCMMFGNLNEEPSTLFLFLNHQAMNRHSMLCLGRKLRCRINDKVITTFWSRRPFFNRLQFIDAWNRNLTS